MLEVRTAAGTLEIVTSPGVLAIAGRLRITRDTATFQTRRGPERQAICGRRIIVARNAARGDVAIWVEVLDGAARSCMRRIFGIAPDRAAPRERLDAAFHHLRDALRPHGDAWRRATELGRGDDHPMLLVERHDRHEVYASRLFREHAQLVMTIVRGEACVVFHPAADELRVDSQVAIRVRGQQVRFVGDYGKGADIAGFPLPWLAPEERQQFARRLARALDGSGSLD